MWTGLYSFLYEVQGGNLSVTTFIGTQAAFPFNPGQDITSCNDNIWCDADPTNPVINNVFVEGPCPTPPVGESCDVIPRLGEPGFSTKNCDPNKVIDVKCKFADSVYAQFKRVRYGIETCCEYDLDKIDIKNQLIDLGFLYDPDLCVDGTPIPVDCCLQPCNAIANLIVPNFVSCPAPTAPVIAIVTPGIVPLLCLAPTSLLPGTKFVRATVSI